MQALALDHALQDNGVLGFLLYERPGWQQTLLLGFSY